MTPREWNAMHPKKLLLTLACMFLPASVSADDGALGDWLGVKPAAEAHGLEFEAVVTSDLIGNVSGGLDRDTAFLQNYDFTATLDTGKAGFWAGGKAFVYLLGLTGEAPSANIGDLQVTDNIEAPESLTLMEAWYEHSFASDRFALLVGLYDYNSEFNVTALSETLINSSFGISPEISQVGPPIFSVSSLTLRAKIQLTDAAYLIGSVSDGVAGSPRHSSGTHIVFGDDDGVFYGAEAGLLGPEGADYYKIAVGGWGHTATFEDASGETQDRNGGIYLLAEQRLYSESDTEGLGGFVKLGFARESVNVLADSFVTGLAHTGAFPGRDSDVLALGVAHARLSDDFRNATEGALHAETAIELNYRASIQDWLAVTPDLQWIVDPGATSGVDDALAVGVRVEIAL